jgi:hypothetical protein
MAQNFAFDELYGVTVDGFERGYVEGVHDRRPCQRGPELV